MSGSRWTLAAFGLWIAVSAFLGLGSQGYLWSNLAVGVLIFTMGIPLGVDVKWEGWTEGVLGAWLIVAAFIPGLREGSALVLNNVLAGLAVATTAFIVPQARTPRHA